MGLFYGHNQSSSIIGELSLVGTVNVTGAVNYATENYYVVAYETTIYLYPINADGTCGTLLDTYTGGTYNFNDIYVDDNYIYGVKDRDGLYVLSYDSGGNITLVDSDDRGGYYMSISYTGSYFIIGTTVELITYTIDGSGVITFITNNSTYTYQKKLLYDGAYLYGLASTSIPGIRTFNIDVSGNITLIDTINNYGANYRDIEVINNYIIAAAFSNGIGLYNVDGSGNISLIDNLNVLNTNSVCAVGEYPLTAGGTANISLLQIISDELIQLDTLSYVGDLCSNSKYIYQMTATNTTIFKII